jgi:hypothetical protein
MRFSESEKVEISTRCDYFRKGEDNLWNICDLEPSHMSRSACNRCRYTIFHIALFYLLSVAENSSLYTSPQNFVRLHWLVLSDSMLEYLT